MSPNFHTSNRVDENGYNKNTPQEKQPPKSQWLQEKQFERRNSLLTDLFDTIPHIATVQHMFVATIICLFMSIILNDYLRTGEITLGFYLIQHGFSKIHISAITWMCYMLVTILAFYVFKFWAFVRLKVVPNRQLIKIWDRTWITILLLFYVAAFKLSSGLVYYYNLPHACSAIVLLEQIRLTMKIHSFVRNNAEKVVKYKPHSDQTFIWPKINHYLYFLFAPTIIYRDEYPRTNTIRWTFVLIRLGEVLGVVLYQIFIFHRFLLPSYSDFGLRKYTWTEVLTPAVADNSLPGLLLLLAGFYQILHSWQNMCAELLKFGDRQFYKDWWTSTSLAAFFRNWNGVVHDWLYTYIYRDAFQLTNGNKGAGKLAVFVTSAVVHEWVMTGLFGFFYPVLSICFMAAAILSTIKFPKNSFVNVIFWYVLAFGSGLICSLYTLEYYARTNQPDKDMHLFKYYFVPRWYTCDCIV